MMRQSANLFDRRLASWRPAAGPHAAAALARPRQHSLFKNNESIISAPPKRARFWHPSNSNIITDSRPRVIPGPYIYIYIYVAV